MPAGQTAAQAPRSQAERTAESDARMLAAAVELICEKGADGTTLKEVGERAGYSRGLAGYRFGNKAGLYRFVVRAIGEEWLAELGRAVGRRVGLAAIHAATDAHARFISRGDLKTRAFYILWFSSVGPEPALKSVIAHIHARRQQDVEQWILKGIANGEVSAEVDVTSVARHFCAAIIGIVYQWLVTPDDQSRISAMHADLKQQMGLSLPPPGKAAAREQADE
ncbi:MAG: TetR/AcrR family transcriptional regulator [Gammaproteobacteria bacterium]|nr:MAG: TetR/AcrR family transcriptional regulator [Gammaproteobacteria bacterium]